ncbi:MAG: ribbon-helix-helix protein, CopG family [Candidatus Caldarchaeum sp.]
MAKKTIRACIEGELLEKLREAARREDVSLSTMVRRIIKLYFARCENNG